MNHASDAHFSFAATMSLLMSSVMMLEYMTDVFGHTDCRPAGVTIRAAYEAALDAGEKTGDIGGSLNTAGFVDAIIARLSA